MELEINGFHPFFFPSENKSAATLHVAVPHPLQSTEASQYGAMQTAIQAS